MLYIPWWIASLVSNVAIIYTEYINRSTAGGWEHALPKTLGPIILAQFCLYIAFNQAPHWLAAWAFFTIGNSLMRVVAVYFFDVGRIGSWSHVLLGITVMLAGAFLLKEGLR